MPAINLLQLRTQLNQLLWSFTDPDKFRYNLKELLEKFTFTAYRPGRAGISVYDKPEFQIPLIVLREMDLALLPVIREQPQSTLAICDRLWNDPDAEIRMISSRILGEIPVEHSDLVLNRAEQWALSGVDHETVHKLLQNASTTIMKNDPEILMRRARNWFVDPSEEKNNLCLAAMAILAEDETYQNLPAIYTILEALLAEASSATQQNIIDLFKVLLKRSPVETIYIIRQKLQEQPGHIEIRIFRKLIPEIPEDAQKSVQVLLRQAIRDSKDKEEKSHEK